MMKTVLRLENKSGIGVFYCNIVPGYDDIISRKWPYSNESAYWHPSPENDSIGWIEDESLHCAFTDYAQLLIWFPRSQVHSYFAQHGVFLSFYEVLRKHAWEGHYQILFDKEKSQLINQIKLEDYHERAHIKPEHSFCSIPEMAIG